MPKSYAPAPTQNRYSALIEALFKKHFRKGLLEFDFERDELLSLAADLGIALPKNVGDVIYSFRYRVDLPATITRSAKKGMEWVIEGGGKASYRFRMVKFNRILPRPELLTIKIPDATPEIIAKHALGDEQALLAKVRYNRLIDIFLGITSYSLQNHLRTTVKQIGQIEIDEIYVGVDTYGRQFVIPVQAKGGNDKHGMVQTVQDAACCLEKFPHLLCRPVSAQFMDDGRIAMFELIVDKGEVKIVKESHYKLVNSTDISAQDLSLYSTYAKPNV
jgi:hypothetical protein